MGEGGSSSSQQAWKWSSTVVAPRQKASTSVSEVTQMETPAWDTTVPILSSRLLSPGPACRDRQHSIRTNMSSIPMPDEKVKQCYSCLLTDSYEGQDLVELVVLKTQEEHEAVGGCQAQDAGSYTGQGEEDTHLEKPRKSYPKYVHQ